MNPFSPIVNEWSLVRRGCNFWVCGRNSMLWRFKIKPLQQYFHTVLFIYHVVLTFESVDEILCCDHSNESSSVVLSHGAVRFSTFYKVRFWNLLNFDFAHFEEWKDWSSVTVNQDPLFTQCSRFFSECHHTREIRLVQVFYTPGEYSHCRLHHCGPCFCVGEF